MFRATQKIKTWLIACLMAVVTTLVAVSACLLPTSTVVNAAGENATWTLVKDVNNLAAGDQIIIAAKDSAVAMSTNQKDKNRGQAAITKSSDTVTFGNDVQSITLKAGKISGTFAFYTGAGYLYAASSSANQLKTETTLSNNSSWKITIADDGTATVIAQGSYTRNCMQYNKSSSLFACYSSASQQAIVIYKAITASEPECEHEETYIHNNGTATHNVICSKCNFSIANNASCTEEFDYQQDGTGTHTVIGTCTVCGGNTKTQENVACEYTKEVHAPTETEQGYTTYTCDKDCGYSYNDNFIPALGQTEATVTYHVPVGVDAINSDTVALNSTITLPELPNPVGYVFEGWTEKAYTATDVKPKVYTGEYPVKADVDLYALYSQTVQGEDSYVKVTEAPADWSGTYLIVYENGSEAYVFNGKDEVNGYVSATITNNAITPTEAINNVAVTIASMSGGYSIKTISGYIYGTSSNGLPNQTTPKNANVLSLNTDSSINITNTDKSSYLRFNSSKDQMRFRYYKASSYTGQKAICLYEFVSGTKTFYQTLDKLAVIDGASITVKDDLTVNYYVTLNDYYASAQMKFTMNGETTTVDGVKQTDGRYKYSFENIAPQQMCENIKAELIFGGKVLASLDEYSIKAYAQKMLKDADEKLQRLLTDLLYYGDEAQKYLGMEATTTAGVEGLAEKATATPNETQLTIEKAQLPAWFGAAGLKFDNVNQLYVRVDGDLEGVTVTVTKNNGEPVEFEAKGALYYTDGVVATEFDTVYTFVLSVNGQELQTLTYSVNSYVYAMKNNANMKDLATALYNYGLAAEAYVA